jgi:hypothetical protein
VIGGRPPDLDRAAGHPLEIPPLGGGGARRGGARRSCGAAGSGRAGGGSGADGAGRRRHSRPARGGGVGPRGPCARRGPGVASTRAGGGPAGGPVPRRGTAEICVRGIVSVAGTAVVVVIPTAGPAVLIVALARDHGGGLVAAGPQIPPTAGAPRTTSVPPSPGPQASAPWRSPRLRGRPRHRHLQEGARRRAEAALPGQFPAAFDHRGPSLGCLLSDAGRLGPHPLEPDPRRRSRRRELGYSSSSSPDPEVTLPEEPLPEESDPSGSPSPEPDDPKPPPKPEDPRGPERSSSPSEPRGSTPASSTRATASRATLRAPWVSLVHPRVPPN